MNTIFLLTFPLWVFILLRKAGYYTYFWQTKEYRFDRMLVHLREPFGLAVIFSREFYVKIIFLALIIFSFGSALIAYPLFFLYLLESVFIGHQLLRKKAKFPTFTIKSFLIFFLSLSSPIAMYFSFPSLQARIINVLFADILTPFIVTLFVALFKPITYGAKQVIVARAKKKRAQFKHLMAIGITGSYGKTSTKEFLAHILASKFRVAHTREHQNTEVGSARAILGMSEDTQVFVAEMAAYHKGDIKEISKVVKPTMGIITAIGPQHVSLFGSIETIIETKFELAQVLPKDGTLIVNWDNEQIKFKVQSSKFKVAIKSSKLNILKYSTTDKRADMYADDIKEYKDHLEFVVHNALPQTVHGSEVFKVNLLGKHSVSNILAATTAALMLGMSLREISEAVSKIQQVPHTMHLHWLPGNIPVIDDSYNASVDGVKAALAYLDLWKDKKRILVMPSLIELGEKAFILHEELGQEIAKNCEFAFITDAKYQEAIWRGWNAVKEDDSNLHFHQTPQNLIQELKQVIDENSVVLLEGRAPKEVTDFLLHC